MIRQSTLVASVIVPISLTLLATSVFAHDAFYPHHREDFESIARRRGLRGPVLIITAGFVAILAGVFYVAFRKNMETNQDSRKDMQTRLERMANVATQAARTVVELGNVSGATQAALSAYAEASGITWNPNSVTAGGNSIRCKIGSDVIIVKVLKLEDKCQIEVHTSCGEGSASSVVCVMISTD